MKTVGIVCEYNPFHLGHGKQISLIRQRFGPDCRIVCAMSGNFVQRGYPAVFDKSLRAKAAVLCGADLVVELPVTCSLSSAEGFAAGAVEILAKLCDCLCFGAETPDPAALMETARLLGTEEFSAALRRALDRGLSFPAARSEALKELGIASDLTVNPNDILAVEYCKAILAGGYKMEIYPILRQGSYHADTADPENPSATAIRALIEKNSSWQGFVPAAAANVFSGAPVHMLAAGERAILGKLRTMTEEEFSRVPYGGEGLWRKFMHACRHEPTLERILEATKSKRYTRSRLDRMVMCAFLGLTEQDMAGKPSYTRALAFSDQGREILSLHKKSGFFLNPGQKTEDPFYHIESRCSDLYGLFCVDGPEMPGMEDRRRVFYCQEEAKVET